MNRSRENFRRRDGQFGTPISVAIWLEHFFVQAHAAQLGEDGAHCDQEEGRRVGPLSWPAFKDEARERKHRTDRLQKFRGKSMHACERQHRASPCTCAWSERVEAVMLLPVRRAGPCTMLGHSSGAVGRSRSGVDFQVFQIPLY